MLILSSTGTPTLATVYVASFRGDKDLLAEFVDARDPEVAMNKKWVVIVSTQFGCPIDCVMCDAGGDFKGNLRTEEIFAQIDHVVKLHPETRLGFVEKFKVQFARMGEPSLNPAVLDVITKLPDRYKAEGLIPCIATIAPKSSRLWLDELLKIRKRIYKSRPFQLQFSINSTCESTRDKLMPVSKLGFKEISEYAKHFYEEGFRKVTLNFALADGVEVDAAKIIKHFDPRFSCVKITPLNPTFRSKESNLSTALPPDSPDAAKHLVDKLSNAGFDVILSIGDTRENEIGSNCGMAVKVRRSMLNCL